MLLTLLNDCYFAQQLLGSQQAPVAQQPASQTQGPPVVQAQLCSTHAQSVQLQAAPQQQAACFAVEEIAGPAKTAARETVTRPTSAEMDFNMT
ncbi:hypothetical protein [Anatilimnocola floriformis]|uniref:hypothetical protein n=1 Tax=Anatilimnocola floriformis TaxID=2948575 RepID=UPI0020C56E7F|nr:hypothetical protein [Anatilimnocola floriformis]